MLKILRQIVSGARVITAMLMLGATFGSAPAFATDVSGIISNNTVWTAASSPYVLTGDLEVRAALTIEAGVRIEIGPEINLTIAQFGLVLAQGTAAAPIIVTSTRDRVGSTPAMGDWGTFLIRSVGYSEFHFVQFRYGQVVQVERSSPNFEDCQFQAMQVAALKTDLQSSPRGARLSASGNTINGILVPPGVSNGARFSITSLPYVVRGGLLHVGEKPEALAFEPTRKTIAPNATDSIVVTLSEPALQPTTVQLSSADAGIASVPPSVVIAQDRYSATVPITTFLPGLVEISATAKGAEARVPITVAPLPTISIVSLPQPVGLQRAAQLEIRLNAPVPATGVALELRSDPQAILDLPTQLVLGSGAQSALIPVLGRAIGTTLVTASAQGFISGTRSIDVVPLSMRLPDILRVPLGTRNVDLSFSHPAISNSSPITLASGNSAVLSVPSTVSFPNGAASVSIPLRGVSEGKTNLSISHPEYGTLVREISVQKQTARLEYSFRRIPKGLEEQYRVYLDSPAPNEGLQIALLSKDPAIASVSPAALNFERGQTTLNELVRVRALAEGITQISTSSPTTNTDTSQITVSPKGGLRFDQSSLILGSQSISRAVNVGIYSDNEAYFPLQPIPIDFVVSEPDKVEATLNFPGGLLGKSTVKLTGLLVSPQPVTVTANAAEIDSAPPLAVTVVTPQLSFEQLDGVRGLNAPRDQFHVYWQVPDSTDTQQVPVAGQLFPLSVREAVPAGIIDGFYANLTGAQLAEGITFSSTSNRSPSVFVGTPTSLGSYRVAISAAPSGEVISAPQTVLGLNLQFSMPTITLGKATRTAIDGVRIGRFTGNTPQNIAQPLVVSLQSSDTSKLLVPSTVTIPAGLTDVLVPLSAIDITSAVELQATTLGYTDATPLRVVVVHPNVEINPERTAFNTDEPARSLVIFKLTIPDLQPNVTLFPAFDFNLAVGIVDAAPSNAAPGLFVDSTSTAPISSISYNPPFNLFAFLGAPTVPGEFRVGASIPGNPNSPWRSALITVEDNRISLTGSAIEVSKGLNVDLEARALGPVRVPVEVSLACASAALCAIANPVQTLPANNQLLNFKLQGAELGTGLVNLSTQPATYGSSSIPITVVPTTLQFIDNGEFIDAELPFGWNVRFTSPGRPEAPLPMQIELVEQNPANAASLPEDPLALLIDQETAPGGYNGFLVTYNAIGTFKFKATIPGVGEFLSPIQSTQKFVANCQGGAVGAGFKSPITLTATLAAASASTITGSCQPAGACTVQSAVFAPGDSQVDVFVQGGAAVGSFTASMSSSLFGVTDCPVSVLLPEFQATPESNDLTVGGTASADIVLSVNDNRAREQYASTPIVFTIESSDPGVLTVPNTRTIDADEGFVSFGLQALAVGTATVTVTAPGLGSYSFDVTVSP